MENFITVVEMTFSESAQKERADQQKKYLKNQFEFYGLTSPVRKSLQKQILEDYAMLSKEESYKIIKIFWQKPQRELQYFALELARKQIKNQESSDIELYEWLLLNKSWWDTVDFIASELVGKYFLKFPKKRNPMMEKWLLSGNIWLQRSAIIFQLKYREKTDVVFLAKTIHQLIESKEFFIKKAIGWSLRQYAKQNPNWTLKFVNQTNILSGLSRREALKNISRTYS